MFKDNLRRKLSENGFEIKEFARFVNIPYSTFQTYVSNKTPVFPTLENAMKIAAALDTTVEELYYGDAWLDGSLANEVAAVPRPHQNAVKSMLHLANEQLRA